MHKENIPYSSGQSLHNVLTANKLIDPTLQKAFIPGINGCIEHNIVMDEVIKDAKKQKENVSYHIL